MFQLLAKCGETGMQDHPGDLLALAFLPIPGIVDLSEIGDSVHQEIVIPSAARNLLFIGRKKQIPRAAPPE